MAEQRPLVLDDGQVRQLEDGDTIVGAGSGSSSFAFFLAG